VTDVNKFNFNLLSMITRIFHASRGITFRIFNKNLSFSFQNCRKYEIRHLNV
jgi:hypothetical protein